MNNCNLYQGANIFSDQLSNVVFLSYSFILQGFSIFKNSKHFVKAGAPPDTPDLESGIAWSFGSAVFNDISYTYIKDV